MSQTTPMHTMHSRSTTHDAFRHEAAFYRGDEEFLGTTVPFVRDAVEAGEPVMVALVPQRLDLLREALGPDGDDVAFVDMARLGGNPASIIPAWRQFVGDFCRGDRPVRGIGEPIWAGRRSCELVESQLHEALLNTALDPDTPLWLRCPYDVASLDADVVAHARRSHPALVEGDDYRGSTEYAGMELVESLFATPFEPPPLRARIQRFGADDLECVRRSVEVAALVAGLDDQRAGELTLAVHEIATNSVRHGGGSGTLSTWMDDSALVCEVRDAGHITDPLVGRAWPAPTASGGRGVWLANQLCDLVQLRSGDAGTAVRLVSWLR